MNLVGNRHKGDQSAIRSVEELDDLIRQIGVIDLAIEAVDADFNVALQELKNKAIDDKRELAAGRNELLVRVQAYTEAHRAELLKDKKTMRLNFGQVGWRKLPDKILGMPGKGSEEMEGLVIAIEAATPFDSFAFGEITIHTERYVMKSDLNKLDVPALEAIGLKRMVGDDEFFVQPDKEKLREYEDDPVAAGRRAGQTAAGGGQ